MLIKNALLFLILKIYGIIKLLEQHNQTFSKWNGSRFWLSVMSLVFSAFRHFSNPSASYFLLSFHMQIRTGIFLQIFSQACSLGQGRRNVGRAGGQTRSWEQYKLMKNKKIITNHQARRLTRRGAGGLVSPEKCVGHSLKNGPSQ